MIETALIVIFLLIIIYLISKNPRNRQSKRSINLEDKRFEENGLKNVRLQEIEDESYYNQIKAEADKQVFLITSRGWVADPSRANLMRAYKVHDKESAKYLNSKPLDLCMQLIKDELERRKKQRELIVQLYNDEENLYPLTPEDCYLPAYRKADLQKSLDKWCKDIIGNKERKVFKYLNNDRTDI